MTHKVHIHKQEGGKKLASMEEKISTGHAVKFHRNQQFKRCHNIHTQMTTAYSFIEANRGT